MTEIRTATATEWDAVAHALMDGFADAYDEELAAAMGLIYEPERSLIGLDGDRIVANAGALTYDLAVPGGVVPAAHVTMVMVNPTHRRQGLLTRLMQRQLGEIHATGHEPVAALWASEATIYPRFGYGMAAQRIGVQIDMAQVRLTTQPAAGGLQTLEVDRARPLIAEVYEGVWRERPGLSDRPAHRWDFLLADPPKRRSGSTPQRITVHIDQSDRPTGYAIWRSKPEWGAAGPDGKLWIKELIAADPETYAKLWHFLLTMDLMREASYIFGAVDEPLLQMVNEPRRLLPSLGDSLWIRIVDLPAALSARRYAAPFELVFDVTDRMIEANTGRWKLTVKGDEGHCERTTEPADLAADIADLGALYLGGTTLSTLIRAGRVTELRAAPTDAAGIGFGWHRAPQAIDIF